MPTVGKGTKMERRFPYTMDGIQEAEEYAEQTGLEVDYEDAPGEGAPAPVALGAEAQGFDMGNQSGAPPSGSAAALRPAYRRPTKLQ